MAELVESVANRINYAMSIRGLTQAELSKRTKISTGSLSQYMTGKVSPKQDRIFIIAKALLVSEAWLMGYDVQMERQTMLQAVDTDALADIVVDDDVKLLVERYSRLNDEKKQALLKIAEYMI